MLWNPNALYPILLIQALIAIYYLVWPLVLAILRNLPRRVSKILGLAPTGPETAAQDERPHRIYRAWYKTHAPHADQESTGPDTAAGSRAQPRSRDPERERHLHVLGLRDPVHLLDIKNAYRSLAKTYHPDRFAPSTHDADIRAFASTKMREVNAAYDWLCANP